MNLQFFLKKFAVTLLNYKMSMRRKEHKKREVGIGIVLAIAAIFGYALLFSFGILDK